MNQDQIKQSLERYGEALGTGDLASITGCWEIPGLVLADDGAITMSDKGQIEGFFARAIGWYQSRGLMATRPELERAVALTDWYCGPVSMSSCACPPTAGWRSVLLPSARRRRWSRCSTSCALTSDSACPRMSASPPGLTTTRRGCVHRCGLCRRGTRSAW